MVSRNASCDGPCGEILKNDTMPSVVSPFASILKLPRMPFVIVRFVRWETTLAAPPEVVHVADAGVKPSGTWIGKLAPSTERRSLITLPPWKQTLPPRNTPSAPDCLTAVASD